MKNKIEVKKVDDKEKNTNNDNNDDDLNKDDFENVMKLSKIVDKNNNQIAYIKNWISPNQNIKFKLLFDGKRDGGQASIFHSFCDNKGPTITFIQTSDKRRIGGFSMKNWDKNSNNYISDDKAFIFDLDKNEKYNINSKDKAIYSYKLNRPTLGDNYDIKLGDNFCSFKNNSYYYHGNNTYYQYSSNIKNKTTTNFICEEIEVYQIIFNI